MKNIYYYLKYRFLHVIVPCLIITFLYVLSSIVRISSHIMEWKISYHTIVNGDFRCFWMMITILMMIACVFFMTYRDLQNGKNRILLLPQSRHMGWIIDTCIVAFFIILIIVIQFLTYRQGFYEYLADVKAYHDFPYWQTRDFLPSLYTSSFAMSVYPQKWDGILYNVSGIVAVSLIIPYGYTMLNIPKVPRKEIVMICGMWILYAVGSILFSNVLLNAVLIIIIIIVMIYTLHKYWQNDRIGG